MYLYHILIHIQGEA